MTGCTTSSTLPSLGRATEQSSVYATDYDGDRLAHRATDCGRPSVRTVPKRAWSGWAIASLGLALATVPSFLLAAATDRESTLLLFALSFIAALVIGIFTVVRVDWGARRGRWMAVSALAIGAVWLVLAAATASVTSD